MQHPHLPPQRAVLPSLLGTAGQTAVSPVKFAPQWLKKEKDCACMSALLSSPSPPQIMLLIINRMRACSSWKAGSGTSLLNGAAQLGLKLFNRNMKAPSVRRTRPCEVTTLSLPSQHPLPPERALLPPGPGSALHPGSATAASSCCHPPPMPAGSPSSHTPFFPAGTLPPLCQGVFSFTPR